jgi:hypothetical protein
MTHGVSVGEDLVGAVEVAAQLDAVDDGKSSITPLTKSSTSVPSRRSARSFAVGVVTAVLSGIAGSAWKSAMWTCHLNIK